MKNDTIRVNSNNNNKNKISSKYITKEQRKAFNLRNIDRNENILNKCLDLSLRKKSLMNPKLDSNTIKGSYQQNGIQSNKKASFDIKGKANYNKIRRSLVSKSTYSMKHIIFIQSYWRQYKKKLSNKVTLIQAVFLGYLLRKYLKEIHIEIKKRIEAIKNIRIVMIKHFMTICYINNEGRLIGTPSFYYKTIKHTALKHVIAIQNQIRFFLLKKTIQQKTIVNHHYICKIGTYRIDYIRNIQIQFKAYLKRNETRKKIVKKFTGIKITRPILKIIFLQRFIRYILIKRRKRPLINKSTYLFFYFFTKEIKSSIASIPNTQLKTQTASLTKAKSETKLQAVLIRYIIQSSEEYYTKTIKPIAKVKSIQTAIRKRLHKEAYYLPTLKAQSFYKKKIIFQDYFIPIIVLQHHIRFFLYRINNKLKEMNKQRLPPMIFTKVINSTFKKLFSRAIKIRLDFDKELMNFVLTIHIILRRYYRKLFFYLIDYHIDYFKLKTLFKIKPFESHNNNHNILDMSKDPLDTILIKKSVPVLQSSVSIGFDKGDSDDNSIINNNSIDDDDEEENISQYQVRKCISLNRLTNTNLNNKNKSYHTLHKATSMLNENQICLIRMQRLINGAINI